MKLWNIHLQSAPQKYWGIYYPAQEAWAINNIGEIIYYPSLEIATAHCNKITRLGNVPWEPREFKK